MATPKHVMGSIDFVIQYDADNIGEKEVHELIADMIKSLRKEYGKSGVGVAIGNVIDSDLEELEDIAETAERRLLNNIPLGNLLNSYLNIDEKIRFNELLQVLGGNLL